MIRGAEHAGNREPRALPRASRAFSLPESRVKHPDHAELIAAGSGRVTFRKVKSADALQRIQARSSAVPPMLSSFPRLPLLALVAATFVTVAGTASADEKISNPIAEFAGLDKITGRIITFDVYMNETVQFGALQVTPRVCYSRPPTEPPRTDAFVEVDEITLQRKVRRIFTGWMFADSPGLHAVDHAVYDVWLANCKTSSTVPQPSKP